MSVWETSSVALSLNPSLTCWLRINVDKHVAEEIWQSGSVTWSAQEHGSRSRDVHGDQHSLECWKDSRCSKRCRRGLTCSRDWPSLVSGLPVAGGCGAGAGGLTVIWTWLCRTSAAWANRMSFLETLFAVVFIHQHLNISGSPLLNWLAVED